MSMHSTGRVEREGEPDLLRCGRLRWVRWIIQNSAVRHEIEQWQNGRTGGADTLVWFVKNTWWYLSSARVIGCSGPLSSCCQETPDIAEAARANGEDFECSSSTWNDSRSLYLAPLTDGDFSPSTAWF